MKYFYHINAGPEFMWDPDGTEHVNVGEAIHEGAQSARDVMAEHLRQGRTLPLDWEMHIRDADRNLVSIIRFDELVLGPRKAGRNFMAIDLYERAKVAFAQTRRANREIANTVGEIRAQIKHLRQIHAGVVGEQLSEPSNSAPSSKSLRSSDHSS